mmetsp:Transcript_23862/g.39853  ORF Transcript_23862/g.39853 Transcript_23862/m.39853 type:complete len:268 (+) Transcript_23862:88-891(+)
MTSTNKGRPEKTTVKAKSASCSGGMANTGSTVRRRAECDCMATRHKFLASCRGCGWIACDKNDVALPCPTCDGDLLPPMTAADMEGSGCDTKTVAAYRMLDKLLQFDKENAKRTHVHDAQADYYESGTWLSEEEKQTIDRREQQRRAAKERLKKDRKIDIRFDIAGQRVVDYRNDEDEYYESGREDSVGNDYHLEQQDIMRLGQNSGDVLKVDKHAADIQQEEQDDADADALLFSIYDNVQLEQQRGKAGDIYRFMKQRWDDTNEKR